MCHAAVPNQLFFSSTYFIVAPSMIRPDQVIQMSVSIINLYQDMISVRAIIRRNEVELAQSTSRFSQPGTKMMQLWVSQNSRAVQSRKAVTAHFSSEKSLWLCMAE